VSLETKDSLGNNERRAAEWIDGCTLKEKPKEGVGKMRGIRRCVVHTKLRGINGRTRTEFGGKGTGDFVRVAVRMSAT